jgi:hypothetical protein
VTIDFGRMRLDLQPLVHPSAFEAPVDTPQPGLPPP